MIEYLIKSFNSYQNYNLFNTLLLIYWTIPKYEKLIKDKIDCIRYSLETIFHSTTVDRKIIFKSKIDVRNIMNKWYYECNMVKPIVKSFGFEDVVLSSLYINKFLNFIGEFNKYKSLESLSFYCIYLFIITFIYIYIYIDTRLPREAIKYLSPNLYILKQLKSLNISGNKIPKKYFYIFCNNFENISNLKCLKLSRTNIHNKYIPYFSLKLTKLLNLEKLYLTRIYIYNFTVI